MRDPVFRAIVASRRGRASPAPAGSGIRLYESENELLDIDPEADGIKTGMTDGAGYALVGHARRARLGVELYVAIIGAPSSDARAPRRQAPARLRLLAVRERRPGRRRAPSSARVPVDDRPGARCPTAPAAALRAPIRIGQPVTETIAAPAEVGGPVAARARCIGTVTLRQGAHVLGRRDLVAAESAGGAGPLGPRPLRRWGALIP